MISHIFFLLIASLFLNAHAAPTSGDENESVQEEKICAKKYSNMQFRLVDLEFNNVSDPKSHLKLEKYNNKVTFSDGTNSCPVYIDDFFNQLKSAAQIKLAFNECTEPMTLTKLAKMELAIKYNDVHGVEKEQLIPMSQLSEELQKEICEGKDERKVLRLEVVPNETMPKVTPVKHMPQGWLAIEVFKYVEGEKMSHKLINSRGFSVTKLGQGKCQSNSQGKNKFAVSWSHCPNGGFSEPEFLRNVEIKVEMENGKNKEKEETTLSLANLPYEELEKLYEGGKAKIVINGNDAKIVRYQKPAPGKYCKILLKKFKFKLNLAAEWVEMEYDGWEETRKDEKHIKNSTKKGCI